MKKTYQTPVITAIDIAVESQILAGSSESLDFGSGEIDYPERAAYGIRSDGVWNLIGWRTKSDQAT